MELAGQLSTISIVIGVIMVILGLIKFFRERAGSKRRRPREAPPDDR